MDITESLFKLNEEIINKIDDQHFINFARYKPLKGSSYVELQHHRKGLVSLQSKDNECFRWCHIKHLN